MLTLCWSLSAAIYGYLQRFMPTNRAVAWLRTPRGLKWAIPVALVATPAYLFAMAFCTSLIGAGAPGWLNVLVFLFFWNAMKFAWLAVLSPLLLVRIVLAGRASSSVPRVGLAEHPA